MILILSLKPFLGGLRRPSRSSSKEKRSPNSTQHQMKDIGYPIWSIIYILCRQHFFFFILIDKYVVKTYQKKKIEREKGDMAIIYSSLYLFNAFDCFDE